MLFVVCAMQNTPNAPLRVEWAVSKLKLKAEKQLSRLISPSSTLFKTKRSQTTIKPILVHKALNNNFEY
jgi:hypothetical protein